MAKRLVWTKQSIETKQSIFNYWNKRNHSKIYSRKLNGLINEACLYILQYPNAGKPTDFTNVRLKVVRDYIIVYEILENEIVILDVWDTRQNPNLLAFDY